MPPLSKSVLPSLPRPLAGKCYRARQLFFLAAIGMALLVFLPVQSAEAASRLKDIADFEGVRDNMLVGYGLVVGLNGTGDNLDNDAFTRDSLIGMLERLGI